VDTIAPQQAGEVCFSAEVAFHPLATSFSDQDDSEGWDGAPLGNRSKANVLNCMLDLGRQEYVQIA
jgi:hypothetical protein